MPVELSAEVRDLDQAAIELPGGAYTTLRTFDRFKVLRLGDHVHRLEETARWVDQPVHLDRVGLQIGLRNAATDFPGDQDLRMRIIVDLELRPGEVYIAVVRLKTPSPEDYQFGVYTVICDLQRQLPRAKLTRFIARAGTIRRALPPGVNEALLVDSQGRLLEGLSSNFFAVRAGQLWTAGEGVLLGTSRRLVLDEARKLGIRVRMQGVPAQEVANLDEAFITSASRAILPIHQIGPTQVLSGEVKGITSRLMGAYHQHIRREIEPL